MTMTETARPSLFLPTLCTLMALTCLIGLGVWQMKRLAWKNDILEKLEASCRTEDAALPLLTYETLNETVASNDLFSCGRIEGAFNATMPLLVGPRTDEGRPGFHVLSSFALSDGGTVLVNRGWIPLDMKSSPPPAPSGKTTLMGLAREPGGKPFLMPDNNPTAAGFWNHSDIAAMARHTGINETASMLFYNIATEKAANALPRPFNRTFWAPRNNHLSYALTWFGLAGALAVIFVFRFLRPQKIFPDKKV